MSRLAATALALLAGSLMAEAAVGNLRVKMPGAPLTRQGKCVTCRTLVDAVGKTMENEKPHQNVDSRKPIRKENGERTGKVTDYKVSELRAMNIMETLCGGVTRPTDVKWVMGPIGPRSPKSSILKLVDKLEPTPRGPDPALQVQFYCDTMMEVHEDLLVEAIRGGVEGDALKELDQRMCVEESKDCVGRNNRGVLNAKKDKAKKVGKQAPAGRKNAEQIHKPKSELELEKDAKVARDDSTAGDL